jgi:hypothetical protein
LLVIVILAVGLGGLWTTWQRSRPGDRPGLATPYRNARPGVRYLGDAACRRCHAEIDATYHRHPMGRSLIPIAEAAA